jgi:hypothetical protein
MLKPALLIVALLATAMPVPATTPWMSADALRATFTPAVIEGVYANGLSFREDYRTDGSLDYSEAGGRALTGRWSVVADTFCTIYTTSGTGGCFRVRQVGANCYEFYFQARTEAEAAAPDPGKPSWTARAWLASRAPTCREAPVV